MFVTSYKSSKGQHYVYDQNGNNYRVDKDGYHMETGLSSDNNPAMEFVPVHKSYTLSCNFAGNYSCDTNDAFAYVTHLLDNGYLITYYEYKPYLCTLRLLGNNDDYKLFIEDGTARIYRWNKEGYPLLPEDLTYES